MNVSTLERKNERVIDNMHFFNLRKYAFMGGGSIGQGVLQHFVLILVFFKFTICPISFSCLSRFVKSPIEQPLNVSSKT